MDDDGFERERLHRAAAEGDLLAVQKHALDGLPINAFDDLSRTRLHYAAEHEQYKVELLLRHGADPDISGWMALTARIRAQRRTDDDGRQIAALIQQYRPGKPNPGTTS